MKQPEFKHLGSNGFPHSQNVDVYKYDNEIDYSRYDSTQMKITLCSVPWDVGQAHIGQRTIDGIGNVVYFGSKEKRDAWFNNIADEKCFRFETKYKELHRDKKIKLPVPYDVAIKFNYVWVEYEFFANDESFLIYESEESVRKFGYFARNVIFESPNTTTIELLEDVWQTFIYDINVSNMILERGHAPLVATSVDDYLSNPLENNTNLLCEDASFGELQQVASTQAIALNSENMKACFVTSSDINGAWLTTSTYDKDVEVVDTLGNITIEKKRVTDVYNYTPADYVNITDGVPAYQVFCCDVDDLETTIKILELSRPQFKQTLKAIFFISSDYIELSDEFVLTHIDDSVTCHIVKRNETVSQELLKFNKEMFNFDEKYRELAKLYTFPYSAIELSDESGQTSLIKVEECSNTLDVDVTSNLTLPYISLQATLKGVGGSTLTTLKFQNVTEKTFSSSGRWYEHIRKWNVATYSVILDARKEYEYSSMYSREQMKNDNELMREVDFRNASKTWDIANRSANTQRAISYRNADNTKTNADLNADATYNNAVDSANTTESTGNNLAGTIRDNTKSTNALVKSNADSTASTTKTNTDESAAIAKDNADRNANTVVLNATAQKACNQTTYEKSRDAKLSDNNLGNALNTAKQAYGAGFTYATTAEQVSAEQANATTSIATGVLGSAVSGAVAGAVAGPVGAGVGAVAGLVSAIPSAVATGINCSTSINLMQATAQLTVEQSQNELTATVKNNTERTNTVINCEDGTKNAQNTLTETTSNNSASTMSLNAYWDKTVAQANSERLRALHQDVINPNTKTTNDAIADNLFNATVANNKSVKDTSTSVASRSRDTQKTINANNWQTARDNAYKTGDLDDNIYREQYLANQKNLQTSKQNTCDTYANTNERIENLVKQANLRAPFEFGVTSNCENSTTKPQALYANIVTQSRNAIKQAGDEFLRYGYRLNSYWEFDGNWCVAPKFTYWKLKDYWISDLSIQDYYQDAIRFFLMGGVTVWSRPEDIGRVSIYDNK